MRAGTILTALVVVAAACTLAPALADGDNHVNFLIGQKSFSDDDVDPLDSGASFGALMSFGQDDWPVHIAADVIGYADEESSGGTTIRGVTVEGAVGVRKIWRAGGARPYLGAGFSVVGAAIEIEDDVFGNFEGDGTGFGPWAGAGVFWRLGSRFNLGFDVRWNRAQVDIDLDDGGGTIEDVDVGGVSYALTLGFGW